MVCAGVVGHPSKWPFYGHNEIQEPKRKNILIDYEKLRAFLGFESYGLVKSYHNKWVNEYLDNGNNIRDDKWTKSIAVGSRGLIEGVKSILGVRAKGRKGKETGGSSQLREASMPYGTYLGVKNDEIAADNAYYWNIYLE
jgi:hypothetical protein